MGVAAHADDGASRRTFLPIVAVLVLYTTALLFVLFRNHAAMSAHRACADAARPIVEFVRCIVDDAKDPATIYRALTAHARFHAVRLVVVHPDGRTLADTRHADADADADARDLSALLRDVDGTDVRTLERSEDGVNVRVCACRTREGALVAAETRL
jgi:hypothetical protein